MKGEQTMATTGNKVELNRFHWFWIGITFVLFTCLAFFYRIAALAQCTSDDLICISMP